MTAADRLRTYLTLLDGLAAAPAERRFLTVWDPAAEPEESHATFGVFLDTAARYAAGYRARGLEPRATVVVLMPQGMPLMAAFVGALMAGVVPAILAYPTFKADPVKYREGLAGVLKNLGARLVVVDAAFPSELEPFVEGIDRVASDVLEQEPPLGRGAWATPGADEVAFIQHSSGTTGLQKGVALSHRAVLVQLANLAEALDLEDDDRIASWLPMYHDMGLIACFVLPVVAHVGVVMQAPTDWVMQPDSFLRLVTSHRSTLCWMPNFALQFLARRVPAAAREGLDLSSLRAVVNCSEPVRPASLDEFHAAYAPYGLARAALASSYAMAETVFALTHARSTRTIAVDRERLIAGGEVVCVGAGHSAALRLGSSGPCLPGGAVRVVGTDGQPKPPGSVGDLWARSESMFSGYYNRADLTAQVLRDGWYRTGDQGFVWDGEVFVLGRTDDVIVVAGKNIHPQDVEEIASSHPDVRAGRAIAFGLFNAAIGTDDIVIVAEAADEAQRGRARDIEGAIRRRVMAELGVSARIVAVVPPRWIVKSTAGKPARSTTRRRFLEAHPELEASA